jgi:peptidoglycan/xylan/chitin deacetylase (PgdA/CDA1 family)
VARHLVCLTFDFDAVSSWIYRGMTTPTPISRGEFGIVAAGRILDLLAARGVASTWFVPGHTVDLLLEHGFAYDSSMMADDYTPYRARRGDLVEPARLVWGESTRLVEMPVAWSLDDHPHFEFVRREGLLQPGLMATRGVLENWLDEFRYMARTVDWGVLTYTFHPQVIGRGHRMLLLERLVDELAGLGATFVRMDAAVDEFDQRAPFARPV